MNRSEAGKLGAEKSRAIQAEKHRKFVEKYDSNPKRCLFCNCAIVFELRRAKFCDHSCAAKFNNVKRGCKNRIHTFCEHCGVETIWKFCSRKCAKASHQKKYIERWLAGEEDGVVCNGLHVSNRIRRWLREQRGNKCEKCGWAEINPVTNKVPVQVDHIDGNALNNNVDNLCLICPNCHSLTPTFGGLNRGKGRKCRYKR